MIYQLMRRNLRIYFRDRASVFFSLLGVFIMIGLYALFLGNMWVEGYGGALESMGLTDSADDVRFLIDSWIIAGVGYLVFVAGGYYAARRIGATANNLFLVLIGAVVLSSVLFWALDVAGAVVGSALLGVSWRLDALYLSALYIAAVIALLLQLPAIRSLSAPA